MAVRLELENGIIIKYPTSYKLYHDKGENVSFTVKSKCDMPEYTECDHLDCAIYAAEYTAKDNKSDFKVLLIGCIFWFSIAILGFNTTLRDLGFGLAGIIALFGIFSIWQSNISAERAQELIEFRDHGTINGVKAHKL